MPLVFGAGYVDTKDTLLKAAAGVNSELQGARKSHCQARQIKAVPWWQSPFQYNCKLQTGKTSELALQSHDPILSSTWVGWLRCTPGFLWCLGPLQVFVGQHAFLAQPETLKKSKRHDDQGRFFHSSAECRNRAQEDAGNNFLLLTATAGSLGLALMQAPATLKCMITTSDLVEVQLPMAVRAPPRVPLFTRGDKLWQQGYIYTIAAHGNAEEGTYHKGPF